MPKGGPGQRKGGERECKVCAHSGRAEIEAMILNGAEYAAIINRMKQVAPDEPVLTKPKTFPNEPSGVTLRTIMSRDGCITPLKKPDKAISAISNVALKSTKAIGSAPRRVLHIEYARSLHPAPGLELEVA